MPATSVFDNLGSGGGAFNTGDGLGIRAVVGQGPGDGGPYRRIGRGVVAGQGPVEELAAERTNPATMGSALDEPGFAPVAGMPGRRRDDDDEYRISTYVESDPNELFGNPERAVRPVIGE